MAAFYFLLAAYTLAFGIGCLFILLVSQFF
jgi:hypothetical protein